MSVPKVGGMVWVTSGEMEPVWVRVRAETGAEAVAQARPGGVAPPIKAMPPALAATVVVAVGMPVEVTTAPAVTLTVVTVPGPMLATLMAVTVVTAVVAATVAVAAMAMMAAMVAVVTAVALAMVAA
jgi:hypothetical protein